MTRLGFDEILATNADRGVGILLSERTQQIALAAIEAIQDRNYWQPTTDAEWDEIDSAIGSAAYEILEEQELTQFSVAHALRGGGSDQTIALQTDTALIWTSGAYDMSNPTRVIVPKAGYAIVSASAFIAHPATFVGWLRLRYNGTTDVMQSNFASTGNEAARGLIWQGSVFADDYFEVVGWTNTASYFDHNQKQDIVIQVR